MLIYISYVVLCVRTFFFIDNNKVQILFDDYRHFIVHSRFKWLSCRNQNSDGFLNLPHHTTSLRMTPTQCNRNEECSGIFLCHLFQQIEKQKYSFIKVDRF